jgi:class 3 adenylate cyclase
MDRHDLPGVTAQAVAQAHLQDIEIESRFGVRFLAYWFDADHGEAFCLADAERPDDLQAVHRAAHGLVPNDIIKVSEDNVLRFLGRINDPVDGSPVATAFRTILFTDLEASTALLHAVGETGYITLLSEHDLIIRRALVRARGREVKHTGDGIMASFDDVANALRCAIAIEDGFDARNASEGLHPLRVRIGMAAGEPVDHNDDLFGATVNLASRICAAAAPGQVLVSEQVHALGAQHGFEFMDAGERSLKGYTGPTHVFELVRGTA